jgi:hypothetical protein
MNNIFLSLLFLLVAFCGRIDGSYQEWKKEMQSFFSSKHIDDPLEQTLQVLFRIRELRDAHDKGVCHLYALLEELMGSPAPLGCKEAVDEQWLYDLEEELLTLWALEDKALIAEGVTRAMQKQREVLLKVKREFGINKPLALLSFESPGGVGSPYYMALSSKEDVNRWLSTAYHEMTHLLYGDALTRESIEDEGADPRTFLKDASLQQAYKEWDRFVELGKQVLSDETRTGKRVKSVAKSITAFYKAPERPKAQAYYMLVRGQELRADLLEFEKLLEYGYLDILLHEMHHYAFRDVSNVSQKNEPWPSDIERVLCIAGFLKDRGVDVNKVLQSWEHKPASQEVQVSTHQPVCPAVSQGMRDARVAYDRWRQKKQENGTRASEQQAATTIVL